MRRVSLVLCVAAITSLAATETATLDLRLMEAVKRRDAKAFEVLLGKKAGIDAAAPDGATPLSWAVFLDLPEMAEKLIAAGARVNAAGEYGETPLTLALANGNVALAEKLLKAGADPKAARWNGETALMIAAGAGSVPGVALLLDRGVDVNGTEPKHLQNALMWAASEGHAEVVALLVSRGANVNAATKQGLTPLVFAARKNDAHSVQRLLAAGANANLALPDGTKVLSVATANGSVAAALALLDGGADPNIADKTNTSPLHIAAETGALDLVKKLLAKGASPNVRTAPAKTASLRQAPGEQTPLLLAAKANRVEVMRALVGAGADTTFKAQDGTGLLLAAALSGRASAAKLAFELDKDVKAVDKYGRTAMHMAVSNPRSGATQGEMTELVQFLADIGVPLDEKDGRGRTAIDIGDVIPLDKPIQRIADIIVKGGGKPLRFPKEYKKPAGAQ